MSTRPSRHHRHTTAPATLGPLDKELLTVLRHINRYHRGVCGSRKMFGHGLSPPQCCFDNFTLETCRPATTSSNGALLAGLRAPSAMSEHDSRCETARSSSPRRYGSGIAVVGAKTAYIIPGSPWKTAIARASTRNSLTNCSAAKSSTRSTRRRSSSKTGNSNTTPCDPINH